MLVNDASETTRHTSRLVPQVESSKTAPRQVPIDSKAHDSSAQLRDISQVKPLAQSSASTPQDAPIAGPSLAPAGASGTETDYESIEDAQSPYSATRSQLRHLTMPPLPNFSIPPSPAGSPPPQITKKFEQFLELKQKGKHFNQNLANSSALRNPTLLHKLMGFAEISDEDQYATNLPSEVAIPTQFPDWAYGDQLDAAQKAITKKREETAAKKQRESLTFVKASASEGSSRSTTPGTAPKVGQSTAERVMAELDRKGTHIQVKGADKGGEGRVASKRRFDQRSRSPRR